VPASGQSANCRTRASADRASTESTLSWINAPKFAWTVTGEGVLVAAGLRATMSKCFAQGSAPVPSGTPVD
jgi:hypothetical protein